MKTNYVLEVFSITLALSAFGQVHDNLPRTPDYPPAFSAAPIPDPSQWANTPVDWFNSIRQFPQSITNNQTGEVTLRVRQVTAVGNGLNYIDSNGAWRQSQDIIELAPDGGAVAIRAPNKVFFSPTLSSNKMASPRNTCLQIASFTRPRSILISSMRT